MLFIQPKHIPWSRSQLPMASSEVFRLLMISLSTSITDDTWYSFPRSRLAFKVRKLPSQFHRFFPLPGNWFLPWFLVRYLSPYPRPPYIPPLSHKRPQGLSIPRGSPRFPLWTNHTHPHLSATSSIHILFYKRTADELDNLLLSLPLEVAIGIFRPMDGEVEAINGTGSTIFGIGGRGARWCNISCKGVTWVGDVNKMDDGLMVWCSLAENEVWSAPNGFKLS